MTGDPQPGNYPFHASKVLGMSTLPIPGGMLKFPNRLQGDIRSFEENKPNQVSNDKLVIVPAARVTGLDLNYIRASKGFSVSKQKI